MDDKYVYILNYTNGEVIAVELSESDIKRAGELESEGRNFSEYVEGELFDTLGIKSDDCHWMSSSYGSVTLFKASDEQTVILDIF